VGAVQENFSPDKQEETPHPSGAPLNQGSKVVLDTTRKILPLLRGGAHRAEG